MLLYMLIQLLCTLTLFPLFLLVLAVRRVMQFYSLVTFQLLVVNVKFMETVAVLPTALLVQHALRNHL